MSQPGEPIAPLDVADLYRRHGAMVLRRARRFFPEEEARDVLQEVFVKVVHASDRFRGDCSPATWLYQITTRYCITRRSQHARRAELWREAQPHHWQSPVSAADQEVRSRFARAWRDLDPELVLIGVYHHLDGMTQADIATRLGVSRRTVGNRLVELQHLCRSATEGAK